MPTIPQLLAYPPCKDCHRPMRPKRALLINHPGTVSQFATGRCATCYNRHHQGLTTPVPIRQRTIPYTPCKTCKRPLRPGSSSPLTYPGTILHGAKGNCVTCTRRHNNDQNPNRRIWNPMEPNCHQCGRLLRNRRQPASQGNGITRYNYNTCTSCYSATRPRTPRFITGTPCTTCGKPMRGRGTKLRAHPNTREHYGNQQCRSCHYQETGRTASLPPRFKYDLPSAPTKLDRRSSIDRRNLESYILGRRGRGVPAEGLNLDIWTYKTAVNA